MKDPCGLIVKKNKGNRVGKGAKWFTNFNHQALSWCSHKLPVFNCLTINFHRWATDALVQICRAASAVSVFYLPKLRQISPPPLHPPAHPRESHCAGAHIRHAAECGCCASSQSIKMEPITKRRCWRVTARWFDLRGTCLHNIYCELRLRPLKQLVLCRSWEHKLIRALPAGIDGCVASFTGGFHLAFPYVRTVKKTPSFHSSKLFFLKICTIS